MIEPTTILTFKSGQKSEGPYAEKSEAELQMIQRDAAQYKDTVTLAKVQEEINTRRGIKAAPVVAQVEALTKPKVSPKPQPKRFKANLP